MKHVATPPLLHPAPVAVHHTRSSAGGLSHFGDASLQSRLEDWSLLHAALLLTTSAAILYWRWPSLLGIAILASFLSLIASFRGSWTPRGSFGWANALTTMRVLANVAVTIAPLSASGVSMAAAVCALLLLDGLDGWIARHTDSSSCFGAHLDMEADAAFILVVTHQLWLRADAGAWVLTSGWLRYAYVIGLFLLPSGASAAPRSMLGRVAFVALSVGLVLAFVLPRPLGAVAAALGTVVVTVSFLHSFYFSWTSAAKSRATRAQLRGKRA